MRFTTKGYPKILYEFYKKPMSFDTIILQNSALSENTKSNTVTQETIRRLSNTCKITTKRRVIEILERFISSLRKSGYSMIEIRKYVTAGIVGYERRVAREQSGGTPVHRPGGAIRSATNIRKLTIRSDWYKGKSANKHDKPKMWGNKPYNTKGVKGCQRDPAISPVFVPRTPGGLLCKQLRTT